MTSQKLNDIYRLTNSCNLPY